MKPANFFIKQVSIAAFAGFFALPQALMADEINDGTLNWAAGTNNTVNISSTSAAGGNSQIIVEGNSSNSANIVQDKITINNGITLTNSGNVSIGTLNNNGSLVNNGNFTVSNFSGLEQASITGTGNLTLGMGFNDIVNITQGNITLAAGGTFLGGSTINGNVIMAEDVINYADNYGTINGNLTLNKTQYNSWFSNNGTITGDVLINDVSSFGIIINSGYMHHNAANGHSVINGQIVNNANNGGYKQIVLNSKYGNDGNGNETAKDMEIEITGGITRTAEGLGYLSMGWNHGATARVKSTIEKHSILLGYSAQNNHLIVDHENNGKIQNSEITISYNNTLTANASDLVNISAFTNNGTINFDGGINANNITGTGLLNITGNVSNTANISQGNLIVAEGAAFDSSFGKLNISGAITNNGTFSTSGTIAKAISGTGTLNINGNTSNEAIITQSALIISGGKFTSTLDKLNISGTITNDSVFETEGTLSRDIAGTGTISVTSAKALTVTGNTTNKLAVQDGGTLNAAADKIGAELVNNGTTNLSAGTISKRIQGGGVLNINGSVNIASAGSIVQSDININSSSALTSAAGSLSASNGINNSGTLTLTNGIILSQIKGTGVLNITGSVQSSENISQNSLTISEGATLTSAFDKLNISGIVTNNGTFATEGTLNKYVFGYGTLNAAADKIGAGLTNAGTTNLGAGTLERNISGAGTLNITGNVVNNAAIAQNSLTISNGATLASAADKLTISGVVTNNGTFEIEGTLSKNIEGTGTISVASAKTLTVTGNIGTNSLDVKTNAVLNVASDKLGAGLVNNGTANLSAGSIASNISGNGALNLSGTVENTASITQKKLNH